MSITFLTHEKFRELHVIDQGHLNKCRINNPPSIATLCEVVTLSEIRTILQDLAWPMCLFTCLDTRASDTGKGKFLLKLEKTTKLHSFSMCQNLKKYQLY